MNHSNKVNSIIEQIKHISKSKQPVKIVKTSVSHFVPNPHDKSHKYSRIKLNELNDIIEINIDKKTCTAESGVTFSDLVKETLKHNLIPYTVPELKTITVGGAVSGCSIESMSYKYGGFHDSCLEYETITGDGKLITCSQDNMPNVFNMLHGSYGTLGVITKIKFKLLSAKPFVKMTYKSFDNFKEYWSYLSERCSKKDYDFIDGIIHSKNKFVVCLGDMVDKAPYTSKYDWLNIYYKSTSEKQEDYLTIYDYFFRYDTECHWLTKTVPLMETKIARFILGKLILGSSNLIKWSNRIKPIMKLQRRPDVVVDVFIPSQKFEEFYKWYENEYDFYPLWIVPYDAKHVYPWINDSHVKNNVGTMFIDCAIYGKRNNKPNIDYSETLEKKTIELNGIKTLISRNHFKEDEFWSVYNKNNYYDVKNITDPNNTFQNLYNKFHKNTL